MFAPMTYRLADAGTNHTIAEVPVAGYRSERGALHAAAVQALRHATSGKRVLLLAAGVLRLYAPEYLEERSRFRVPCARCNNWTPPDASDLCPECLSLRRGSRHARGARRDTPAQLSFDL